MKDIKHLIKFNRICFILFFPKFFGDALTTNDIP